MPKVKKPQKGKKKKTTKKKTRLRKSSGGRGKKKKVQLGRPKKVFIADKLQELVEKGKTRGFVTYSEILYLFPDIENDLKGLEKLLDDLESRGIEVIEIKEFLTIEEKPAKKLKSIGAKIDPVQMYLKEIGAVSFVTAAEEKELSKKIESPKGMSVVLLI